MENKRLKYLFLDMDGTIVDSETVYLKGYELAFANHQIPIKKETLKSWCGRDFTYVLKQIDTITKNRNLSNKIRDERIQYFIKELGEGRVHLKAYVYEVIDFCKKNNIKVALVTSTVSKWAICVLKKLEIYELFDGFVFGDSVKNRKPASDCYKKAIEIFNANIDECLVIEDSKAGVMAAINAHLRVIYIPDDESSPSFDHLKIYKKLTSLKDVTPLLKELI